MKYFKIFAIAALALSSLSGLNAEAQRMSDLTKTLFSAYDQTLAEDPEDYITYYRRAVEYYKLGQTDEALADIASAIKYAPAKEADLLAHAYSLQADVYLLLDDNAKANAAIDKALTIDPKSYYDLYKKGEISLRLNDTEAARRAFNGLFSLKNRSQDAFFGLAKTAFQEGNRNDVLDLIEEIKNVDSTSPTTFYRLGDLYAMLGDNNASVINYLTSISLTNNISKPFEAMERVAAKDFNSFSNTIDGIINRAGDGADSYRYIKGVVSEHTGHLNTAYDSFRNLSSTDKSSSTMARIASVALKLNKLGEARTYLQMIPEANYTPESYLIRSQVELASGASQQAIQSATKAYDKNDPDAEALLTLAKANIAAGNATAALAALNEAVLLDAESLDALLLRAYVKRELQKDEAGALADLNRAASSPAEGIAATTCKAVAQTLSGKAFDGAETINRMLVVNGNSPEACAYAAIYYSQTGNEAKANEYSSLAKAKGFENLFLLDADTTPYLSIKR